MLHCTDTRKERKKNTSERKEEGGKERSESVSVCVCVCVRSCTCVCVQGGLPSRAERILQLHLAARAVVITRANQRSHDTDVDQRSTSTSGCAGNVWFSTVWHWLHAVNCFFNPFLPGQRFAVWTWTWTFHLFIIIIFFFPFFYFLF